MQPYVYMAAGAGTGFTFLLTVIGAGAVLFMKRPLQEGMRRGLLGFAAGIMIASSVWSLLLPAIEMAQQGGGSPWLTPALGFLSGGAFLLAMEKLVPMVPALDKAGEGLRGEAMLCLAVTLHNIPEGMAVGLAFAIAGQGGGAFTYATAAALALGVGLQNLPEGAAISMPLRGSGMGRGKAFLWGAMSGAVEPVAGLATVLCLGSARAVLPFLLAFAAGAMIYVVLEELVPQAHFEEGPRYGTVGAMFSFVLMMVLDVALG